MATPQRAAMGPSRSLGNPLVAWVLRRGVHARDALLARTFINGDSILVDLEESLDADGDKVRKIVLKRCETQNQPDNPELVGA